MYKSRYSRVSKIGKRNKLGRYAVLFFKAIMPVALVVVLIWIARADFFQAKYFEVSGARAVSAEEIKKIASVFASGTRFFFIPKTNMALLDGGELAATLLLEFGRLENVEVNKKYLNNKIVLSVKERPSDFVWCSSDGECFFMTKEGLVFEKISGNLPKTVIFRGLLEGNPIMKNFSTAGEMAGYIQFSEVLQLAGINVSSIKIESKERGVAETAMGDIIFNPDEEDLPASAQNALLLIEDLKKKNPSLEFEYMDVRFGNKIFYKI